MTVQLAGKKQFKRIIIRGKAVVFVDWANVHGWKKNSGHLGREVWDIKIGLFKAQLKNLMDI